jgi:LCP family protein required for cell wall assembly
MNPVDRPGSHAHPPRRPGAPGSGPIPGTGPAARGPDASGPGSLLADPPGPGEGAPLPGTGRKRRWPKVVALIGAFVLLVASGCAALIWERQSSYNGNIDRLPSVMPTGKNRPGPNATGTENWLLVGSDTRAEAGTTGEGGRVWRPGAQRSDTLMLLHLPADRSRAYIISFPRDSWVQIPGYGPQKINAAFSFGGPPLLIETVESLTGVRVDHFGAIDFNGFKSMTDALGGVTVNIDRGSYDSANKVQWQAGRQKLDGEKALLFVRQRYGLPGGDFDRIKRQQAFLQALAQKAAENGTVTNPIKLNRFLSALTKSISVDDSVSAGKLRSMVLSMRGMRPGNVSFLTVPNAGPGWRGDQSVVVLDKAKSQALFQAVRQAEVARYVQRYGGTNRVGTVN